MDDVAYLAMAGAVAVFAAIVWWAYRRVESRGKRVLSSLAACVVSLITYFLLGVVLIIIHPEHAHDVGAAIGRGIRPFTIILIVVNSILFSLRSHPKTQASAKSAASVREQLLKARQTIQERIESLQSSPQHDYRGGVPQTDTIIDALTDQLREIDKALAELGPQDG